VLPGQHVDDAIEGVRFRLELEAGLADAHLVLLADGHPRAFLPELDEHQPPPGLEHPLERTQHRLWVRQLVVDVDHQDEIHRSRGQPGVRGSAEHELHVRQALGVHLLPDERQHLRLNVDRKHAAGGPHDAGEPDGVVTRTRAHVGHGVAGLQTERRNGLARRFFGFALGSIEPGRPARSHDLRDPST